MGRGRPDDPHLTPPNAQPHTRPHSAPPSTTLGYLLLELLLERDWVKRIVIALRPKFFPTHEHMLTVPPSNNAAATAPAESGSAGGGGAAEGVGGGGAGGAGVGVKKKGLDAKRFKPLLSRVRCGDLEASHVALSDLVKMSRDKVDRKLLVQFEAVPILINSLRLQQIRHRRQYLMYVGTPNPEPKHRPTAYPSRLEPHHAPRHAPCATQVRVAPPKGRRHHRRAQNGPA